MVIKLIDWIDFYLPRKSDTSLATSSDVDEMMVVPHFSEERFYLTKQIEAELATICQFQFSLSGIVFNCPASFIDNLNGRLRKRIKWVQELQYVQNLINHSFLFWKFCYFVLQFIALYLD